MTIFAIFTVVKDDLQNNKLSLCVAMNCFCASVSDRINEYYQSHVKLVRCEHKCYW